MATPGRQLRKSESSHDHWSHGAAQRPDASLAVSTGDAHGSVPPTTRLDARATSLDFQHNAAALGPYLVRHLQCPVVVTGTHPDDLELSFSPVRDNNMGRTGPKVLSCEYLKE